MKINPGSGEFCLADNQPLALREARGATILCTFGILWLTVEGEAGDTFLRPGQRHRIVGNGLALVESIGGARLRIERPRRTAMLRRMLRGWPVDWLMARPGLS